MNWRLILDGAATGAWNMAVDEALLLAQVNQSSFARAGAALLRLESGVSIAGSSAKDRFKKYFEGAHSQLTAHNSQLVRRPTGGRAVWHEREITYCAVFRAEVLPTGATGVVASYRWLSEAFLEGLQTLGIAARLSDGHQSTLMPRERSANCFEAAAQCDAIVGGRKLIGAAQCRKSVDGRTAILQHGSLLLDVDEQAWHQAMRAIGGDAAMENVVSLHALGVSASRADVIGALCDGLARMRGVQWNPSPVSEWECSLAHDLQARKYRQKHWNEEGRAA